VDNSRKTAQSGQEGVEGGRKGGVEKRERDGKVKVKGGDVLEDKEEGERIKVKSCEKERQLRRRRRSEYRRDQQAVVH